MVSRLYNQCDIFEKLCEKQIHVEKSSNPTLQELSDIRDFKDRIEFAKEHFELLGEGSSRTAFQLNHDLIIKIAHNDKGLAQCLVEMKPGVQKPCVNNAVMADPKGKWVIFRSNEKLTREDFEKLVGFSFSTFMNSLFYSMNNESDKWSKPKDLDTIRENELFKCVANLVFENQLLIGDLDKISSWGLLDGKPVIRDAGLDKDTYNKFYADEDSSSSSSSVKTSE